MARPAASPKGTRDGSRKPKPGAAGGRQDGAKTAATIRRVAQRLLFRQGYAAMNLRELAAEVGIQPSSLYNHIATKQGLLFDLMREHMETLLASTDEALAAAGPDPMDRLRSFVGHHVLYHMERKQETYIANFELRSLDPPNYAKIVALRGSYEARLIALLQACAAAGQLDVPDARVTAYAMLGTLTSVCTWYRPGGRLSKAEIVAVHTALVLDGLRPRAATAQPARRRRANGGSSVAIASSPSA